MVGYWASLVRVAPGNTIKNRMIKQNPLKGETLKHSSLGLWERAKLYSTGCKACVTKIVEAENHKHQPHPAGA